MKGIIRQGVTRAELQRIALLSQRPEERLYSITSAANVPDYDSDAISLELNGEVVAAGGMRMMNDKVAVLWIVSMVDLKPYRRPLLKHAHSLMKLAKERGLIVVSFVPNEVERAKVISEHLGLRSESKTKQHTMYISR